MHSYNVSPIPLSLAVPRPCHWPLNLFGVFFPLVLERATGNWNRCEKKTTLSIDILVGVFFLVFVDSSHTFPSFELEGSRKKCLIGTMNISGNSCAFKTLFSLLILCNAYDTIVWIHEKKSVIDFWMSHKKNGSEKFKLCSCENTLISLDFFSRSIELHVVWMELVIFQFSFGRIECHFVAKVFEMKNYTVNYMASVDMFGCLAQTAFTNRWLCIN